MGIRQVFPAGVQSRKKKKRIKKEDEEEKKKKKKETKRELANIISGF